MIRIYGLRLGVYGFEKSRLRVIGRDRVYVWGNDVMQGIRVRGVGFQVKI